MQMTEQQARALARLRSNPDFLVMQKILEDKHIDAISALKVEIADVSLYRNQGRIQALDDITELLEAAVVEARRYS